MSDLESTDRATSDIESQDLSVDNTLVNKVLDCLKKSKDDYTQQPRLNYRAIYLAANDMLVEEQDSNESQKAVELKAKALFELEQVIVGIEQFKQICE